MKDILTFLSNHKADIGAGFTTAYLAGHRIYTYVVDKGGLRSMWAKFMGPKQQPPAAAETKQESN